MTGHEDYSAELDYVLQQTGFDDLFFVAYSMGTTQYFVLLSEKPEYNDKVKAGFMMGPATFMGNAFSPIFALADYAEDIQELFHMLGKDVCCHSYIALYYYTLCSLHSVMKFNMTF